MPVVVLGSSAAQRLAVGQVHSDQRLRLGGQWFPVAGILQPATLAPEIDNSALVGYPAAQAHLDYVRSERGTPPPGPPSALYVRAANGQEAAVQSLLARTANPQARTRSPSASRRTR